MSNNYNPQMTPTRPAKGHAMKLILTPIAALALTTTTILAAPASAHAPSGGASCGGVFAQGSNYSGDDTNTLTVTIDDATETAVFGADGYLEGDIPQDGREHTWSWAVDTTNPDPSFSASDHGTITCGTPPPLTKKRAAFRVVAYCNGVFLDGRHNATVTKTKVRTGVFQFAGHATHSALFDNGTDTRVIVRHVKSTGCGTGSRG